MCWCQNFKFFEPNIIFMKLDLFAKSYPKLNWKFFMWELFPLYTTKFLRLFRAGLGGIGQFFLNKSIGFCCYFFENILMLSSSETYEQFFYSLKYRSPNLATLQCTPLLELVERGKANKVFQALIG